MKKYNIKCKVNEQMEVEAESKEQALRNFIEWLQNRIHDAIKIEEAR